MRTPGAAQAPPELTISCSIVSPSPRPMLSSAALREALAASAGFWHDVRVVAETGSTNADLLAAAKTGAPEGAVLAAEPRPPAAGGWAGAGSARRARALTFSVLLRPAAVPPAGRGWVPLLAGVAVAAALRGEAAVDARLKWPNDVLVRRRQAGRHPGRAGRRRDRGRHRDQRDRRPGRPAGGRGHVAACSRARPAPTGSGCSRPCSGSSGAGTALEGEAGDADRSGLRAEYLRRCATIGQQVRVSLPGGTTVTGEATDVDRAGRLVVRSAAGPVPVSAGDVIHVR